MHSSTRTNYLESKPRFDILDGLRGVAAIVIVFYHLLECYTDNHIDAMCNHGYLGVEFFLVLSGFVMGYAYDDRWNSMGFVGFAKRRLVRMHPLILWAAMLGMTMFYYTGGVSSNMVDDTPWWLLLAHGLITLFLIPIPSSADIRGWGEINSINGPVWTLMYEYVANVLYAFVLRFLPKWLLVICLLAGLVCVADLTLNLNIFGLIGTRGYEYSMIGGFYFNGPHVYVAFVRTLCPFLIGLMLSRCGWRLAVGHGFWLVAVGLFALLTLPYLGTNEFRLIDGIYQFICIALLFPLLLVVGAGSTIKGRLTYKFCRFLGDISYPIYLTNYPFAYLERSWVEAHPDAPLGTRVVVFVATFLMILLSAWAVYRLYDLPVRTWLRDNWLRRDAR